MVPTTVPVPVGPEFLVNTTTAGTQEDLGRSTMNVASDAQGNFVVVWQGNGTGDSSGVFSQRYDSFGTPLGSETRVNVSPAGAQIGPTVARVSTTGNYVVAWTSDDGTAYTDAIARVYSSNGTPLTGEILVGEGSSKSKAICSSRSVAMDADGNFVVVYTQTGGKGPGTPTYYVQRYNATGVAQWRNPIKVATASWLHMPASVAMDADGDFVVAWCADYVNAPAQVYAQRYSRTGQTLGSRIQVSRGEGAYSNVNVSMNAAGAFVVTAGASVGQEEQNQEAEIFNPDGTRRGNTILFVSGISTEISAGWKTGVAILDTGGFMVSWTSPGAQFTGARDIYVQRFDADGLAKEAPILANTTTAGDQYFPTVAAAANGNFVVVWHGPGAGDDAGMFGRRFELAEASAVSESAALTTGTTVAQSDVDAYFSQWSDANTVALAIALDSEQENR